MLGNGASPARRPDVVQRERDKLAGCAKAGSVEARLEALPSQLDSR
ncbi:MAG: hypothetical protein U0528_16115 [Anaerolineae bacterium]